MTPVISVVMPTLNEEKYVERTLNCLRNQKTSIPYEIVVCDSYSIDKTVQIAKKYADKIVFEPKKGIAYGRNTGVKNSSGKYIINVDADTYYPNDFIQKAYKVFKQEKYVGFFCGHWDLYDGRSVWWKKILCIIIGRFIFSLVLSYMNLRNTLLFAGWSLCTPRWVFDKVGGFSTNPCVVEDAQYALDIEHLGLKTYIPNIKVRSSVRRFTKGIKDSIKHYSKLKFTFNDLFYYITRKSRYPFNKIFGINEPDFYILISLFALINIALIL